MTDERGPISDEDMVFDVLSSGRRRTILQLLHDDGDRISLRDLADRVAAMEYRKPVEDLSSQERKRVYTSFYQTHVPKLEEAGVISFDSDEGVVHRVGSLDLYGPYLGWEPIAPPFRHYYLAFSAISALFYGAVVADVPIFQAIPDSVAGLVVIVGMAALSMGLSFRYHRGGPSLPT